MKDIEYSGTLKVGDRIKEQTLKGIEVINLAGGGSLENTPRAVKEATKKAVDDGLGSKLTEVAGLPELRRVIADKLSLEEGLQYDPDREIMVTVGAKNAILMAMQVVLNPGDEVIILDPYWTSYKPLVELAGGEPKIVPMRKQGGKFVLDSDLIRNALSARTRMIILNSPSNPTGRVFSRDEIEGVAQLAVKHDLFVLSDECYKELVFQEKHISIASLEGMIDRTIVVYSFGKAYTMFGWRIGYAAGRVEIVKKMLSIQSNLVSCPTTFAQSGALAAFQEGQKDLPGIVRKYHQLRDMTIEKFSEIKGISCSVPEFGYSAFPDVSGITKSADSLSEYLLEKWHLAVTPGSAFGTVGKSHVRVNYRHDESYLEKGLTLLQKALDAYRQCT